MINKFLMISVLSVCMSFCTMGFACSLGGYQDLIVDPDLPAIVFDAFEVSVNTIKRGSDSGSSCDDLGWVTLEIADVDPEVGYTVTLAEGEAPKNLGLHETPLIPDADGTVTLVWSDDISDDQPPVNFVLRVTAIAPNGDEGPSRDLVVSDPGVDGGCSATGHQDASLLGLLLFGLAFQIHRRQTQAN